MKTKQNLFVLVWLVFIFVSGCNLQRTPNLDENQTPTLTEELQKTPEIFLNPCDLLSTNEWEAIVGESPLFFEEIDGGCRVKNQWDTKSIFVGVYPEPQIVQTLQWFTLGIRNLTSDSEILFSIQELLDQTDLTARQALEEQIALYELLNFRTERIYTVGDYTMWVSYHESATNILESLETDRFLRVEAIGFYALEAKDILVDLSAMILERAPEVFSVRFVENTTPQPNVDQPVETITTPLLDQFFAEPDQIRYGSLCEGETALIQARISNTENINSVLFVYRLIGSENNPGNWTTIFIYETEPGIWTKSINAEADFSAAQLTAGNKVEAFIAVLYGVDQVINFDPVVILSVDPCTSR